MRCAAACRAAPLCLRIRAPPGVDSPLEEQAAVRAALQGVCASWPGTAELDLRGCPLEDRDVAAAAAALPRLASLHLSGCKKLTPGLLAGGLLRRPALRTVTLQRCFQLTSGALTDVLAAAGAPGSRLACAALSHLSLADWPEAAAPAAAAAAGAAGSEVPAATAPAPATRPAAAAARGPPPAGGLRMLALQNCTKLGHGALAALADACPSLEALMLGGTSFAEAFAAAGDGTTSAGGDGDASEAPPAGLPAPLIERFYDSALDALAEGSPLPALLGSDTSYASYIASIVAHLAALVAQLPRLRVLELTFGLPGLAPALQRLAVIEPQLLAGRPAPLQVWDLCSTATMAEAQAWRRGVAGVSAADADALLCAAVNCSSGARATPLHVAAEEGETRRVSALLALGAAPDARDRGGATPLFTACEAGRAGGVAALLAAGASATQRNSAGEAPLYIAALKGHQPCVDALLAHCAATGINWLEQRLYDGDGWTPLMAAAVGGRTSIVLKLLAAAGQDAPAMVQAANKYGQNAVHVAARKAGPSLLRCLVDAGGAASLFAADAEGKVPADIAQRNGNGCALRLLADAGSAEKRHLAARQRATQPTAERSRAGDHTHRHPRAPWVGRRLQQRKGTGGPQGSSSSGTH
ncbi:serine threonine-phosphatase 6 regulatory ankyrin repeat subunit A [Micractinium conductrix]|uniref:Serine threonine-phosphatase 6 regulatory ankyrin repeat subunit A n=1 Tax=Micractinium conductrix TaxID=554055 RepID=A0A2P6VNM5_9CHLO|nr:serine threonine-phosphatase 6 regulatory ankyrin repeat subunit A [Micractinium conductrix]|eukprot:PSC75657.1 serine threonine-phosphatase 6 regulatory ankyrin repeat subunit A [Micractinium conductrix]